MLMMLAHSIPLPEALELQARLVEASGYWEYELVIERCGLNEPVRGLRATFKPNDRISFFFCQANSLSYFVTAENLPAARITDPVEYLRRMRDQLCQGRYR